VSSRHTSTILNSSETSWNPSDNANTPKAIAAIHDSVKLARLVLRNLNAC
jgi:hypothetical protein